MNNNDFLNVIVKKTLRDHRDMMKSSKPIDSPTPNVNSLQSK